MGVPEIHLRVPKPLLIPSLRSGCSQDHPVLATMANLVGVFGSLEVQHLVDLWKARLVRREL